MHELYMEINSKFTGGPFRISIILGSCVLLFYLQDYGRIVGDGGLFRLHSYFRWTTLGKYKNSPALLSHCNIFPAAVLIYKFKLDIFSCRWWCLIFSGQKIEH